MEDVKVSVKIKLAGLWTAVMFCYTYADILAHMRSDIVEGIIAGELEGIQITQQMLVASAILMLIPILMIFLSLALKPKTNRWANIILGIVYFAINLITMLTTGGAWIYYYVFATVEVVFSALIVWYAMKWK
jgi:uncharacterized membrane protein HdeD (DUF308 family)